MLKIIIVYQRIISCYSAQVDVETCVIIPVSTVWAVQTDRLDEWEICSVVDVVCMRAQVIFRCEEFRNVKMM